MKVLITSSSFKSVSGEHRKLIDEAGFDVDYLSGPLKAGELIEVVAQYDGILMGNDEYTKKVLEKGKKGELKVLSKFGVGLDNVDLMTAKKLNIKIYNTTGECRTAVSEHVFALLLSYSRKISDEFQHTKNGSWVRLTGFELKRKTIGIVGLGNIGKEVVKLALVFGMKVKSWDKTIVETPSLEHIFKVCDVISLHLSLTEKTKGIINSKLLEKSKEDLVLVNTARGGLVNQVDLKNWLKQHKGNVYLTDVLEKEPLDENCLIHKLPNVFITPHIASRTRENIEAQGIIAAKNLIEGLEQAKKSE